MRLDDVVPAQAKRSFVVAKTRSGKSTLACVIIERYRRAYPDDLVIILDPKRRYFAARRPRDVGELVVFPDGYASRVQRYRRQWRRGVRVYAKCISANMGFNHEDRVLVVQEPAKILAAMQYLYRRGDARRPVLLFADESFDLSRNGRAQEDLKRLIQQGGEISVGTLVINQRPRDIPRIFLTESERLYVGRLLHDEDRLYMRKQVDAPPGAFDRPLPPYTWMLIDQDTDSYNVFRFRL